MGLNPSKGGDSHNNKYMNYLKTFVLTIKVKLSEKNKKILLEYEEFCRKLYYLYTELKNLSLSKENFNTKKKPLIEEINLVLSHNKILLPTIDNTNKYQSENRNNLKILWNKFDKILNP